MAWLLRDGEVLAALEVASDRRARRRGLLGRDGVDGALLLLSTRAVHTVGMRFPIDVAFCAPGPADGAIHFRVVKTVTMARHRIGLPCRGAGAVIEAEAGAFARWGLQPGDQLEVR